MAKIKKRFTVNGYSGPTPPTGVALLRPPIETTFRVLAQPNLAEPNYLQELDENTAYGDNAIRSVMKVTSESAYGTTNPRIHYPKTQLENLNGDKAILWWHLVNVPSMTVVKEISAIVGQAASTRWSNVDNDKIYYISGTKFYSMNVNTEVPTLIYDFLANGYTANSVTIGGNEGVISKSDTYCVFQGTKAGVNRVVVMNITPGSVSIVADKPDSYFGGVVDHSSICPKEDKVYVSITGVAQAIYSRDLNTLIRNCFTGSQGSHIDIGQVSEDENSDEVMCSAANPFSFVNIETGAVTANYGLSDTLVNVNGNNSSIQISTQCTKKRGWCSVSCGFGNREIFAVKLDGSGQHMRFGSFRNNGEKINTDDSIKGTPNRDLTAIYANGAWKKNGWTSSTPILAYRWRVRSILTP